MAYPINLLDIRESIQCSRHHLWSVYGLLEVVIERELSRPPPYECDQLLRILALRQLLAKVERRNNEMVVADLKERRTRKRPFSPTLPNWLLLHENLIGGYGDSDVDEVMGMVDRLLVNYCPPLRLHRKEAIRMLKDANLY